MTLRDRYINQSNYELLSIVENPENYTEECLKIVDGILELRIIEPEDLEAMVTEINRKKIQEKLGKFDPINDEITLHESQYLSKTTIKEMYLEEVKILMDKRDGFRFDVWKYAIGG